MGICYVRKGKGKVVVKVIVCEFCGSDKDIHVTGLQSEGGAMVLCDWCYKALKQALKECRKDR